MKKISIHIYIVLAIFIACFIVGSFVDLSLMEALFSEKNGFGLFIAATGTIPGYGVLALLGGMMFAIALKKEGYTTPYRVIFYLIAAGGWASAVFFAGREFFGVNGFSGSAPSWVGFLIALPIMCGISYLGYLIGLKSDNNRLWLLIIVLMIAIFFALVPGVTLLKAIFHRPRYRIVVRYGYEEFHNWWQPFSSEARDKLIELYKISKDEFKSFPSGHGGASAVFMILASFLPLINSKYEKLQVPLFYVGFAWTLLVCFTRILVGAHFLSDVSMGCMLTVIFLIIAYYVVTKGKIGLPKQENIEA